MPVTVCGCGWSDCARSEEREREREGQKQGLHAVKPRRNFSDGCAEKQLLWKRYFNVESPEEQNMRNFKIKSGKLISTLKDAVFCNYLSTNCILCLKNFDEGGWHFHSFPCVVRHFPQSCCQQPRLGSLTFTPEAIGGSSFTHNYPPNYRQTATGITFSWHNARCVLFFTHNYPRNYPESVAGIAFSYRVVGSC